MVIEQNWTRNN